jgi:hypothetical protein
MARVELERKLAVVVHAVTEVHRSVTVLHLASEVGVVAAWRGRRQQQQQQQQSGAALVGW